MKSERYSVVSSTDDNYAKYLAIVFASVLRNTAKKDLVDLYCIDGGISKSSRDFIIETVETEGGKVSFLELDSNDYDDIETIKHITKAAFYRLRIPYMLSDRVDKALYLDCDLIVRDDVTKLWELDIESYDVAAVENLSRNTYKRTGLRQSDYFNSGVLFMNLTRWRENHLPEKITKFKKNNPDKVSTNDQCAINCIVNNNWYRLPLKWNHQTGINRKKDIKTRYSNKEIAEAILNPSIVHFIGADKPWKKYCYHPWKKLYIKESNKSGLTIDTANNLELFFRSLRSFSLIRKYIRTRLQCVGIRFND